MSLRFSTRFATKLVGDDDLRIPWDAEQRRRAVLRMQQIIECDPSKRDAIRAFQTLLLAHKLNLEMDSAGSVQRMAELHLNSSDPLALKRVHELLELLQTSSSEEDLARLTSVPPANDL